MEFQIWTLSPYPGQRFDQRPSNGTATEGGSIDFSCDVSSAESSTRVNSVWGVRPPGEGEGILGINDVSMVVLKINSLAFIGGKGHLRTKQCYEVN